MDTLKRSFRMSFMVSLAYTAILACFVVVPGCVRTEVKENVCGSWKPIIPDGKDSLTTDTANQILAHDCRGYWLGCWKPPGIAEACAAPTTPVPGSSSTVK